MPDGRARHLTRACEASRRALGVERIHLYQLHAPDPRVPLATSVRALDALKRDGHIESIGLCNVNVGQIEEARRITEIAAVQVELSVWKDDNILNGVVAYCLANGIPAARLPPARRRAAARDRLAADPLLAGIRRQARRQRVRDRAGVADGSLGSRRSRRRRHARSKRCSRSLARRDHRLERWRSCTARRAVPGRPVGSATRRNARVRTVAPAREGEVVLIMGLPGAGKSTVARIVRRPRLRAR